VKEQAQMQIMISFTIKSPMADGRERAFSNLVFILPARSIPYRHRTAALRIYSEYSLALLSHKNGVSLFGTDCMPIQSVNSHAPLLRCMRAQEFASQCFAVFAQVLLQAPVLLLCALHGATGIRTAD
jgi:hypothetical protein